MEDIKECITDVWKEKFMPTKASAEPHVDAKKEFGSAKSLKRKSIRKDMKKAKGHIVRASTCHLKMLIMEVGMHWQACDDLKPKH